MERMVVWDGVWKRGRDRMERMAVWAGCRSRRIADVGGMEARKDEAGWRHRRIRQGGGVEGVRGVEGARGVEGVRGARGECTKVSEATQC